MSIVAMRAVRPVRDITGPQKHVLMVIADHADDDCRCYLSLATIAAVACISESSARRALRTLESTGLITSNLVKGLGYWFTVTNRYPSQSGHNPSHTGQNPSHPDTPTPLGYPCHSDGTPVSLTGEQIVTPVRAVTTPVSVTPKGFKEKEETTTPPTERARFDVAKAMRDDTQFSAFIAAYPKGTGRVDAFRIWWKMPSADRTAAVDAVGAFADAERHTEDRWIQSPAKWLTDHRWLDDFTPRRTSPDAVDYGAPKLGSPEDLREKAEDARIERELAVMIAARNQEATG